MGIERMERWRRERLKGEEGGGSRDEAGERQVNTVPA